ncbi:MAG TPA: hypothetical protein VFU05_18670 [Cyclobacteriaceae bacterium]|nr:hypothetical protein [Cyclobacteriaceae bacterium]
MTSQPDKLFREKLENFQRPTSATAWERIESGLNKNQSKGFWLKFAAGISLFGVAAFLLWPTDQAENQQASNPTIVTLKTVPTDNAPEQITPATKAESPTPKAAAKNKSVKKTEAVLQVEPVQENKVTVIEPVIVPTEQVEVAVTEVNTSETIPSKTIVYSAEEVNAKFLKKKSPSEATASEKKTSGIQKLMGLAYTIKNPEQGIGDLRQKKDEILALNFLSNEDKTNKEKN